MRWFVTGCRGQLGSALRGILAESADHELVGARGSELDVADAKAVARACAEATGGWPDVLVNAAAYTNVDGCETEARQARRVNAEAPGALAALCREHGSRLVHVSTDFVFDGSASRPYREEDETRPLSVYGQSKLEGERAALAADEATLVVRTAWLYGDGRNFLSAVCERAGQCAQDAAAPPLRVVEDQRGSPTYARDLAEGLVSLVE